MSRFVNGPAHDTHLQLRRTPILLRAVFNTTTKKWDALDHPDDSPAPGEEIHCYILMGPPMAYHLCARGKNRGAGGWFEDGAYKFLEPQPPKEAMRDNEKWSAWCEAHREELMPAWNKEKP